MSLGAQAGQTQEAAAKSISQPTMTERLEMKKEHLEAELARANEALEALKANPEIERVMNLVIRAQGGY
jgi:hypothetical protein